MSLHHTHVIKRPLLTEKNTFAMNEQGRYSFEVDRTATKPQIKAAVEKLYNVSVVGVNTSVTKAKDRRYRYGLVRGALTKKATVRLKDGQAIELF
ncbi:MAG: 50S ribosomal protein L23 [Phycisphaerae bacterium]|nr:50S ribosomal protein L23 [Phycisphaerae bacterium]